jgi:hypothetical protein
MRPDFLGQLRLDLLATEERLQPEEDLAEPVHGVEGSKRPALSLKLGVDLWVWGFLLNTYS